MCICVHTTKLAQCGMSGNYFTVVVVPEGVVALLVVIYRILYASC